MRRSAPEFWSSCRLWNGRWPGSETPFCALSVAMDFDDRGVDHGVFHVWRVGAGLEKPGENIRFDPVAVALENSVPVAEQRRKITPRAARPHDPEYRFDKAAVVASAAPGGRWLTQTMRLHLRPLRARQHESFHPKLESQPSFRWNPDSQQALNRVQEMPVYQAFFCPRITGADPSALSGFISENSSSTVCCTVSRTWS